MTDRSELTESDIKKIKNLIEIEDIKKMRTIKIYLSKFFVLLWVNKNHSFAKNIDDMRTKDFDQ